MMKKIYVFAICTIVAFLSIQAAPCKEADKNYKGPKEKYDTSEADPFQCMTTGNGCVLCTQSPIIED